MAKSMPSFVLPLLDFNGHSGPQASKYSLLVTYRKLSYKALPGVQEMILADECFNFNYYLHNFKV